MVHIGYGGLKRFTADIIEENINTVWADCLNGISLTFGSFSVNGGVVTKLINKKIAFFRAAGDTNGSGAINFGYLAGN